MTDIGAVTVRKKVFGWVTCKVGKCGAMNVSHLGCEALQWVDCAEGGNRAWHHLDSVNQHEAFSKPESKAWKMSSAADHC